MIGCDWMGLLGMDWIVQIGWGFGGGLGGIFIQKYLHVYQMRNVISPIQHWTIDERLCILYEDLLNAPDIKIKQKIASDIKDTKLHQKSKLTQNCITGKIEKESKRK